LGVANRGVRRIAARNDWPAESAALNTLFPTGEQPESRIPRILGYGLAFVCLVWVLRDFHVVQAMHQISNVDWKWVLLGMCFDVLSYGVQALRWECLLRPFGKVRLTRTIRAVFAGLFANLVFPLRPGEFLRSYLLSTSENISLGRVLGSLGVERLIDLVIATASLAIASLFVDLPRRFNRIADILGVVTLVVLAVIVAMIFYIEMKLGDEPPPDQAPRGFGAKVMGALSVLHAIGTAPSFYPALLTSLLMPFCQVLGLWAMMHSFGLQLPFLAALVVLLVINLGVSLPNAPANVGSYQFFCVLGLSVFEVEKTTATAFSIFAFLALTFPFVFLGFAALVRSGLSMRSMREKVGRAPGRPQKSAMQT
jgi:glycosyltransferase 2 family protein